MMAVAGALACAALGMLMGTRLSRRCARLRNWQQALFIIRAQCVYARAPLWQALKAGGAYVDALTAIAQSVESKGADPFALFGNLRRDALLTSEEWAVLASCMQALAHGGAAEQDLALTYASERFRGFCESAQAKRDRDTRLFISLGWLGGACVFLLLA